MRRGEDAVANGLPAAVAGPPVPARGEERRFDQRQRDDARAWALAGGVAIYGDIGRHRGCALRPRVVGQLRVLLTWARRQGLPHRYVQVASRGFPAHMEVAGRLAEALADRR